MAHKLKIEEDLSEEELLKLECPFEPGYRSIYNDDFLDRVRISDDSWNSVWNGTIRPLVEKKIPAAGGFTSAAGINFHIIFSINDLTKEEIVKYINIDGKKRKYVIIDSGLNSLEFNREFTEKFPNEIYQLPHSILKLYPLTHNIWLDFCRSRNYNLKEVIEEKSLEKLQSLMTDFELHIKSLFELEQSYYRQILPITQLYQDLLIKTAFERGYDIIYFYTGKLLQSYVCLLNSIKKLSNKNNRECKINLIYPFVPTIYSYKKYLTSYFNNGGIYLGTRSLTTYFKVVYKSIWFIVNKTDSLLTISLFLLKSGSSDYIIGDFLVSKFMVKKEDKADCNLSILRELKDIDVKLYNIFNNVCYSKNEEKEIDEEINTLIQKNDDLNIAKNKIFNEEIAKIEAAGSHFKEGSLPQVTIIIAPAGTGKSYLVNNILKGNRDDTYIFDFDNIVYSLPSIQTLGEECKKFYNPLKNINNDEISTDFNNLKDVEKYFIDYANIHNYYRNYKCEKVKNISNDIIAKNVRDPLMKLINEKKVKCNYIFSLTGMFAAAVSDRINMFLEKQNRVNFDIKLIFLLQDSPFQLLRNIQNRAKEESRLTPLDYIYKNIKNFEDSLVKYGDYTGTEFYKIKYEYNQFNYIKTDKTDLIDVINKNKNIFKGGRESSAPAQIISRIIIMLIITTLIILIIVIAAVLVNNLFKFVGNDMRNPGVDQPLK